MKENDIEKLSSETDVMEAKQSGEVELTTETINATVMVEPETAPIETDLSVADDEAPLDENVKLMSPTRMLFRRFFRSKLSIAGMIMLASLFLFCWLGPVVYNKWGETESDTTKWNAYVSSPMTYDGEAMTYDEADFVQIVITANDVNRFRPISSEHLLGTDQLGMDVFTRIMYGGRLSLTISFLAVFLTSALGIIMGGFAGFYGGVVDNIIMRLCDVLMCLPTLPLMLIIGTVLDANGVPSQYYIYLLMGILSFFSWPGMARLVRGQILFLREQEYMVAAEAMGYSTVRKIFKHLIPNILPQIIVSMTLSLGSMILSESTLSYLNLGVRVPYASWGTMISIISGGISTKELIEYANAWVPPGICIIIAVLGFNFIGDGLRDALDPKQRR